MSNTVINKIKSTLVALLFMVMSSLGFLAVSTLPASAALSDAACTGFSEALGETACGEGQQNTDQIDKTVDNVINILSVIVAAISVVMIIIGGFKYATSTGDPGSTKGAKDTIIYAIVGLMIVAIAQSLVKFVISQIGGGGDAGAATGNPNAGSNVQ